MSTKISKDQRAHLIRIVERVEFPLRIFDGTCTSITIGGVRLPPLEEQLRHKTGRFTDHRGVYEADFEFRVDLPSGWLP